MRAGDLRRKVTIQTKRPVQDSALQQLQSWQDTLMNVPADIQTLSGNEQLVANAMNSGLTHTIVVRYHPMLADSKAVAGMRVTYVQKDGPMRVFDLHGAENIDETNKTINLMASEGMTIG